MKNSKKVKHGGNLAPLPHGEYTSSGAVGATENGQTQFGEGVIKGGNCPCDKTSGGDNEAPTPNPTPISSFAGGKSCKKKRKVPPGLLFLNILSKSGRSSKQNRSKKSKTRKSRTKKTKTRKGK